MKQISVRPVGPPARQPVLSPAAAPASLLDHDVEVTS